MARPTWVPKNDEQREAIEAVVRAVQSVGEATAALADAVRAADQLDVPRSHLAEAAGKPRRTFYRYLDRARTDEP